MNGEARPFTTVEQAFVAELIGCAAYKSVDVQQYVSILDIVPADLKDVFLKTYQ